jgi:adenosylhomocysteine nucleosidase
MRRAVILGAVPQELAAFARRIDRGRWRGVEVHLGLTGIGKPAAAAATQRLVDAHHPDAIVFTGVAGALDPALRVGDIGIGVAAIDAELDLRSLRPGSRLGEDPFAGRRLLRSDRDLAAAALSAGVPRLFPAYIASGSVFLDGPAKHRFRAEVLPQLAAELDGAVRQPDLIEMEGSAVLQTAEASAVPALAIRAVSDALDGDAAGDFEAFIAASVEVYAAVVEAVLDRVASRA